MKNAINKYGHLRPGTYEITSDPYWKNPDKYLTTSLKKKKQKKNLYLQRKRRQAFQKL